METQKPWYLSRTIWASVVTIVSAAAALLGVPVAGLDDAALAASHEYGVAGVEYLFAAVLGDVERYVGRHEKDHVRLVTGDKFSRARHPKGSSRNRTASSAREHEQFAFGVKGRILRRLYIEPHHHLSEHLTPDRKPVPGG